MATIAEAKPTVRAVERSTSYDRWLLASVVALLGIGLIMVYSSSIVISLQYGSPTYFLKRELIWIGIGSLALMAGTRIHYSFWRRYSTLMFVAAILLLVAVLIPHVGTSTNGAQRWFQLSGMLSFQPSEFAKLALAVYLAHWLSVKGPRVTSFRKCSAPFGIILGLVCLLILKQPDMGTAIVIALSMLAVYFVAGARLEHFAAGVAAGLALAYLALKVQAYRGARMTAWLNPWKDPSGTGYHTIQALLALGLGGLTGVGLGNSQQKYVLPAPYTDSIFAITAEELGLLGALLVIGLFVTFAYRGFRVAANTKDDFGRLLAVGLTASIIIQAFLNIAVITASLPFTGVPLPFISFGGSSLVISMLAVGILLNISRHSGDREKGDSQNQREEEKRDAHHHHRREDGRTRSPGHSRHRKPSPALVPTLAESAQDGEYKRQYG
jgi:cell division protein FtsW